MACTSNFRTASTEISSALTVGLVAQEIEPRIHTGLCLYLSCCTLQESRKSAGRLVLRYRIELLEA